MTVSRGQLPKAFDDLLSREHLAEAVVLSTCMRTEIYAVAGRFHGAMSDIRNFLAAWSGSPPERFSDHLYSFYEDGAVSHLFQVAAGIDSAVLGEGEVLGQVRDAWDVALRYQAAGPVLFRLFRHAVEAGKKRDRHRQGHDVLVTGGSGHGIAAAGQSRWPDHPRRRRGRDGGGHGPSPVGCAWSRAGTRFQPDLDQSSRPRQTLRGSTGGTRSASGGPGGGRPLADVDRCAGNPARGERSRGCATRSPRPPLLVVDIAVPRDVDPAVGRLPSVTLLNMDDLKAFVDAGMAERRKEIPAVNRIVAEEVGRFAELTAEREMAPVVASLRDWAEELRTAELEKYRVSLAGLDERQRAAVEGLTRGLLAKLLHQPTVNLTDAAGSPRAEQLAEAVRILFNL